MVYRLSAPRTVSPTAVPSGDDTLDVTFGALAHRSRRALLRRILDTDAPLAMNDLASTSGMSPQLLNKHAAALERAGLISRVPHGRERRVYAHPEVLASAQQWIGEISTYWNTQLEALDDYIAGLPEANPNSQEE